MRNVLICAAIGALVFVVATGMQVGLLPGQSGPADGTPTAAKLVPTETVPKLKFPEALAQLTLAKPLLVPQAAAFRPSEGPHKIAVLRPGGALHPWHDEFPEEWQARSVETAELVLVVARQKKSFVEHFTYPNGAPPITRSRFSLEVSVVEAKTGKLLDNRLFRNEPRRVRQKEAWATTALGRPVERAVVFRWLALNCGVGFTSPFDAAPITNVVD